MTHRDRIAVGVDGTDGSRAATRWAAREADRLGLGLLLVHAYTGYHAMGSFYLTAYPLTPVDEAMRPQSILDGAVRIAEQILPRDKIDTSALRINARSGLLQAGADARLLVLGDETHPAASRMVTGSVVGPVAAHAPVPVVVVPANWEDAHERRTIVVGVKSAESAPLIRHGFQLAARHGAQLTVLHAWEFLAMYDDAIAGHADLPSWEQRATASLTALLDGIRPDFPGVDARVKLVRDQPARALVDASAEADLLLITRRPHAFPFGHLGGTGRAVLRETRCPTVVYPPAAEPIDLTATAEAARVGIGDAASHS